MPGVALRVLDHRTHGTAWRGVWNGLECPILQSHLVRARPQFIKTIKIECAGGADSMHSPPGHEDLDPDVYVASFWGALPRRISTTRH